MGQKTNKEIVINTKPHAIHAYRHRNMSGDMAVRLMGNYNYIMNGKACFYLSVEQAKALVEEVQKALDKPLAFEEKNEYSFNAELA